MPGSPRPRALAVLFDYGLTLVSFDFPHECLRQTMAGFGDELAAAAGRSRAEPEELLRDVLLPIEEKLPGLGEDEVDYLPFYAAAWRDAGWSLPEDLLLRVLDAEQRCWDAAVRVIPEAEPALRGLRRRGLRTAICSNAPFPPAMMHRQVRQNGLEALVDAVVFSSEVGRRKPAPELYVAVLRRLGVRPEQALFVGDQVAEDYEGPRRLGMRAVLCTALAKAPPPDDVPSIASLAELDRWL